MMRWCLEKPYRHGRKGSVWQGVLQVHIQNTKQHQSCNTQDLLTDAASLVFEVQITVSRVQSTSSDDQLLDATKIKMICKHHDIC